MSDPGIYVGVDLGGTNFSVGCAHAEGKLLAYEKFPTLAYEGPEAVLARIAGAIFKQAGELRAKVSAVGIGLPGLVDVAQGKTIFLPNLATQWRDVAVSAILQARLNCPVRVLNDARAAALGEFEFGQREKNVRSLVFLTLGTGVGGGVVVDGTLRLGAFGAAGEIGHLCLDAQGPWCGCGSRGCLETFASGPALTAEGVRLLLSGNAPQLNAICGGNLGWVSPLTMAQAAREGEASVAFAIEQAGIRIGQALAQAALLLHPELVVIGGGMAALDELLLQPIRQVLAARVRMYDAGSVKVIRSQLDDKAGVLGGLALARGPGALCVT